MNFDINRADATAKMLEQTLRWDVTVTLDERRYVVRPLVLADLEQLKGLSGLPEAEVVGVLNGLFVGDAPDFVALAKERPDHVRLIALAIMAGFKEHLKKKSQAQETAIEDQARYRTPGT